MGKKDRLLFTVLAIITVSVITGGTVYLYLIYTGDKNTLPDQAEQAVEPEDVQQVNRSTAYLYFTDKKNTFLIAEEQKIHYSSDPVTFGKTILDALIKGPRHDAMQTIPGGTRLNAFFVTGNKTAYVDLSETIRKKHPGGVQSELITIYSIVNTLTEFEEIEMVKIHWF